MKKNSLVCMILVGMLMLSFSVSAFANVYEVLAEGECYTGDNYIVDNNIKLHSEITVYYQGKGQTWSNYSYGYGTTIAEAGCGLLALTNAVYHLNGNFLEPTMLADFSLNNGYRIQNNGTAWAFFQGAANYFGEEYQFDFEGQTSTISTVKSHLQNGGVATCRQPGHFMAIVDYDAITDKYLLLDSAPSSKRGTTSGYSWKTAAQLSSIDIDVYFMLSSSKPQHYNPQGIVDQCVGGMNSITISGWAFDMDNVNSSIQIHVYIGGSAADSSAEGYPIMADIYRNDVNEAYGIGGNHGFSAIIPTNKTGIQSVYVYACNIDGGTNVFLGDYTVEITNEKGLPVISDIQIINITEHGYTVMCTVEDDSGISEVKFPTWSDYHGQDDIIWYDGIIEGKKAYINIDIKNHNNEHGEYRTHIYAYDLHGNVSSSHTSQIGKIKIPIKATPAKEIVLNNKKYILYENENNLMWHEAKLFCEEMGGYLATVTSAEEQKNISDLIGGSSRTAYYLGGTDEETEGEWKWITDETWEYSNWNNGEPNDSVN